MTTTRDELAAELESVQRTTRIIGRIVWAVAGLVMFFGIPIVIKFLTAHGIPGEIAWMLSVASDGALCVGLVATPVLAKYELTAGWVGMLRWIAGFMTWALQTAGSWFDAAGVDRVGVAAHSAGPILLFVVVEAASSFQRKMGAVVTAKQRSLESLEKKRSDDKATLQALRESLSAAERERTEALSAARRWEAEALSGEAERSAVVASLEERARSAEGAAETLRSEIRRVSETLRTEHAEALRKLRAQHRETLSEAVAQAAGDPSVIRLADHRKPSGGVSGSPSGGVSGKTNGGVSGAPKTPSDKPTTPLLQGRFSDEAAVQALLESSPERTEPWSQNEIVTALRVGFGRAPRLMEAVNAELLRKLSGEVSATAEATG